MDRLIKIWLNLPKPFRLLIPKPLRLLILRAAQEGRRLYRPLLFRRIDAKDRANGNRAGLPPAECRYKVGGVPDAESFVRIGEICAADIQLALSKVGRELNSFERILDFGCGCGRTLIPLVNYAPSSQIYGTDIDFDAIAWCREHLNFASFSVASAKPPTDYASDTFDFIYAISVFTHLDQDYQFRWLDELRRIAQSGAILLLTVDSTRAGEKGFVFEKSYEKGLFPAWYQNAYQSKEYVIDNFCSYFDLLGYFPQGLNNYQDVVVLQKQK